ALVAAVPLHDVTLISLDRPKEKDFRLSIEVAAVSRRNRMSVPSIRTLTMGKRSQRSMGISGVCCGSCVRAAGQTNNKHEARSKQRLPVLESVFLSVESHMRLPLTAARSRCI